jgi:CheY-like chemotaxis protein
VLCVDDNRDAADSAALLLELYGCAVAVCYDGASALAEALKFAPDVCLIDYNMPGMNGCELAERLRAWRRSRPVHLIAVTAYGTDAARERTAKAGFDRHLVKPVDWNELTVILSDIEHTLGRAERVPRGTHRGH